MKKVILLFAVAIFSTHFASAQEFEVGTNAINLGVGFGGGYYGATSGADISPGFSASYERGFWDAGPGVVSLGAFGGYKSYKYRSFGSDFKWNYISVGVRGAYHYTGFDVDNLDVYGGVVISYDIYDGDSTYGASDPNAGAFVGGRWYFSDNFAAFAEAGYGASIITVGATLRF